MVICQKCKKEISLWKSYPQKGGYSLCKDCRKDAKDNPKILNDLQKEASHKLEDRPKKIIKTGKGNLVVKVKKERRNIIATIILLLIGLSFTAAGVIGMIYSILLILTIIGLLFGFFLAIGSGFIATLGVFILRISIHKGKEILCPNCGGIYKAIFNENAFTCGRCQKRILVEYSF